MRGCLVPVAMALALWAVIFVAVMAMTGCGPETDEQPPEVPEYAQDRACRCGSRETIGER